MVIYASNGRKTGRDEGKDTLANIRATGEFVCQHRALALRDAMNASSRAYPAGTDEFALAGLSAAPSRIVAPPRVARRPAALECRLWRIVELPGGDNYMVIGEVVGVHIAERVICRWPGRRDALPAAGAARLSRLRGSAGNLRDDPADGE